MMSLFFRTGCAKCSLFIVWCWHYFSGRVVQSVQCSSYDADTIFQDWLCKVFSVHRMMLTLFFRTGCAKCSVFIVWCWHYFSGLAVQSVHCSSYDAVTIFQDGLCKVFTVHRMMLTLFFRTGCAKCSLFIVWCCHYFSGRVVQSVHCSSYDADTIFQDWLCKVFTVHRMMLSLFFRNGCVNCSLFTIWCHYISGLAVQGVHCPEEVHHHGQLLVDVRRGPLPTQPAGRVRLQHGGAVRPLLRHRLG